MTGIAGTRLAVAAALLVSACAGDGSGGRSVGEVDTAVSRVDAIDQAVEDWARATTTEEAHAAASDARDLVTGSGAVETGLLPGRDGSDGLTSSASSPCVERDVLGGSWSDPAARWATFDRAVDEWRPDNNTFPSLPSHPQRIVGWALLSLATDDVEEVHEYAGHARLHVDITREAFSGC